jgi:hypothetical protein
LQRIISDLRQESRAHEAEVERLKEIIKQQSANI